MYNKKWICNKCGYETNRKQNYETHIGRQAACEKRLRRLSNETLCQTVVQNGRTVAPSGHNVALGVAPSGHNVALGVNSNNVTIERSNKCNKCNKILSSKRNLERHEKQCNGDHPLQCSICKVYFKTRQGKYKHMKNVKCELVLTEEQQRIKELEEELEERDKQLEESEAKRIEAENKSKTTVNYNITNNNNNNNYFDHSINYNNYDNLSVDHITKDDIKRLFNNCRMQYPELSEDVTRMMLKPKENQCIYLPEGQKSNTCTVIKDGVEMRKPLIRVLMDLAVQAGVLIRDSNVIERNKKDVINNQFWADNRNACGLNISDIEYMTDNDKEIVQRNKNIVLDMGDGKIK